MNANCLGAQSVDAYWDYADYLHGNQQAISGEKGHDAQFAELDKLATLQAQKHNLGRNQVAGVRKNTGR